LLAEQALRRASLFSEQLRGEVAALKACLLDAGILREDKFRMELHRQRFAISRRETGWMPGVKLADVLGDPLGTEDAFGILAMAGSGSVQALRTASRASMSVQGPILARLYVWGGVGNRAQAALSGMRFDFQGRVWEPVPRALMQCAPPAAVLSGHLYHCGILGMAGRTVQRFSPATGVWELLPNMTTARHAHALAVLQNKLYVCGGFDQDWITQKLVECFDPSTGPKGEWRDMPQMLHSRSYAVAGAVHGRLFVCGGQQSKSGIGSSTILNSAEELDIVGDMAFVPAPSMPVARCSSAGVVLAGKFYVCGGETSRGHVLRFAECYDPLKRVWTALPPMTMARKHHAAIVVAGCLYVGGGATASGEPSGDTEYQDEARLDTFERYSSQGAFWEPMPEMTMPSRRSGLSMGVLPL